MGDAAFFFDLDGTICDSKPGILASLRHAMRTLGRPVAPDTDLDWCIGPPMRDNLRILLPDADSAGIQSALDLYRGHYAPIGLFQCSMFEGMAFALATLRARAPQTRLYVVTSKVDVYAEQLLVHLGQRGHFSAVYGSRMDGSLTDKGELISLALKGEGLAPESVTMIGDREHDMRGASKAGVRSLGVLWGYGSEAELKQAGAQGIIAQVRHLPSVLLDGTRP